MSFIVFDRIHKAYGPNGGVVAIEKLDLSIERGEFMTFLGPSGSGKTTTLMMLAGFEAPTSGAILLDGRHIEELPPYARDMGVVFQSYSLFPHMTVAQNVAFPLEMRRLARDHIRQRVSAALARVRLDRHADRRPMQLSGGEQQRVALARALVFDPQLVLMDEPLSALDKSLREELQLEIRRLHRELGVTMVFVTHDQAEAMTLSDRIAVFNRGKIEQLGPPSELYNAPHNRFVAGFIGDNNTAYGTIIESGGAAYPARMRVGEAVYGGRSHQDARGVGMAASLCVRPESLRLTRSATNEGPHNHVPASVIDMIHQGNHWRLILRPELAGVAQPWMMKCSPTQLPAGLQIGQGVNLTFSWQDAWIL